MQKEKIINEYFRWMYSLIEYTPIKKSYLKLLAYLHTINFFYIIDMDGNRATDGIDLRYRFAYEKQYDKRMICSFLDDRDCSVLEMMVALAFRCEEQIMDNPDVGNRTGFWFFTMIKNLGFLDQDDVHFDKAYVNEKINIFLNRKYKRNGVGGLFVSNNYRGDFRYVDIWRQMCLALNEMGE